MAGMGDMETKPKVIVAVPCSDDGQMKVQTAHAIGAAIISAEGAVVNFFTRQSCDIVGNRTFLVEKALQTDATHILFVDCDMFFPADTITRLLARNKEIVGVEYNKRQFPLEGVYKPKYEKKADDIYAADHVGTGLLLIDLDVFKDPMFGAPDERHPHGTPWFNFGRDSQGKLNTGEDVWFCNVAQDAGYTVWIDPTIKTGHIGQYLF